MTKLEMFHIGGVLFFAGFIFNIIETAHFGWNVKAQSPAEMLCDFIAIGLMYLGLFFIVRCFVSDN